MSASDRAMKFMSGYPDAKSDQVHQENTDNQTYRDEPKAEQSFYCANAQCPYNQGGARCHDASSNWEKCLRHKEP